MSYPGSLSVRWELDFYHVLFTWIFCFKRTNKVLVFHFFFELFYFYLKYLTGIYLPLIFRHYFKCVI